MSGSNIVVLTGFEAFAGFQVNPSWEAAKMLDGREMDSYKIRSFQIPLRFKLIRPTIINIIETQKPVAIISVGQSYRALISLERVATNCADLTESTVLYNCGARPRDEILEPNAPAAYFTTLPIRRILDELLRKGVPAEISYTAGTFGCNQLFFHTLHKIRAEGLATLAGFIHVPCLPSQAAQLQEVEKRRIPSMSLEVMTNAVEISVRTTLESLRESLFEKTKRWDS